MSYILNVRNGTITFNCLVKAIEYVNKKNPPFDISEIKKRIKKEFDVEIGEFDSYKKYTPVDFGTEQNYMLFLLRWA
jgi:hypothetical protein